MTFLDHAIEWLRNEAFEMSLLACAGVVILIIAAALWRFAPTPMGQALPIPLAIIALLFLGAGLGGALGTPAKIATFNEAYALDPRAFLYAEKARVEAFQILYTYTLIGAAIVFAIALMLFAVSEQVMLRAIAICLVFLGLSGLVIDVFSKERSNRYYEVIKAEVSQSEHP